MTVNRILAVTLLPVGEEEGLIGGRGVEGRAGVTFSRRDQKLFIHLMSLCTARLRNLGDPTLAGVGR